MALFVNEYEFELVRKMTGMDVDEILDDVEFLVVTLGSKGVNVFYSDQCVEAEPVPPEQIVDPTGAGDAFRGGFLTGYSHGWDYVTCARMGALSATYCLESDGPQGQDYTREEYVARFRRHYDDGGLLDALLNE